MPDKTSQKCSLCMYMCGHAGGKGRFPVWSHSGFAPSLTHISLSQVFKAKTAPFWKNMTGFFTPRHSEDKTLIQYCGYFQRCNAKLRKACTFLRAPPHSASSQVDSIANTFLSPGMNLIMSRGSTIQRAACSQCPVLGKNKTKQNKQTNKTNTTVNPHRPNMPLDRNLSMFTSELSSGVAQTFLSPF